MARETVNSQPAGTSRTRVFHIKKPQGRLVTGTMISGDIYIIRPTGDDEKELKAFVDKLCGDKGYWNAAQGKWIVRHGFVNRVLATLSDAEQV
ncbi:hypothetical protein KDW82_08335 [Burkholderia vietnamiensis]|uniref:hypothetical protein n=1 Tax=Burkholderia vietnamiensis TaxID=60552 RepID=UPI001B98FBE7|nr:hypothetical protein [Burkholderia vietnamiensis]MBR8189065.1 hypothetical protein [Burkholderia vietnamiensis]